MRTLYKPAVFPCGERPRRAKRQRSRKIPTSATFGPAPGLSRSDFDTLLPFSNALFDQSEQILRTFYAE